LVAGVLHSEASRQHLPQANANLFIGLEDTSGAAASKVGLGCSNTFFFFTRHHVSPIQHLFIKFHALWIQHGLLSLVPSDGCNLLGFL
jgi:hypothetical protein